MATQHRPALAFGHASPDSELSAVIQCISQALGHHRTLLTDSLRLLLGRALDEKVVRFAVPTGGLRSPILDPIRQTTRHRH